jgi:hypothetical protein
MNGLIGTNITLTKRFREEKLQSTLGAVDI